MTLAILCDACGAVISQQMDRLDMSRGKTPEALSFAFAHEFQRDVSRHFCDWACLAVFATRQQSLQPEMVTA